MARNPAQASFLDFIDQNFNGAFQPYGAGPKRYGGGRSAPNVGPVTNIDGYRERELRNKVYKKRMMGKLKKRQQGREADPAVLANQQPESYRRVGY